LQKVNERLGLLSVVEAHNVGHSQTAVYPLARFLKERCGCFVHIEHPIANVCSHFSSAKEYKDGKIMNVFRLPSIEAPILVLYFLGILKTLFFLTKMRKRFDLFIAGDELNASLGVALREAGFVKKVVFYSIDYFPQRFINSVLNRLFQIVESVAVCKSDYVWNISERCRQARVRQGADEKRSFVVPHGIEFEIIALPLKSVKRRQLIYVGSLEMEKGVQLAIKSMPTLLATCPRTSLVIIGSGSYERRLKEMVGQLNVGEVVEFRGRLDRQEIVGPLRESAIGLATFVPPSRSSYVYYSFPGKVIEYLACGLPVITTKVGLAEQIENRKAGLSINFDEEEFVSATLKLLLAEDALFQQYRINAISLASEYRYDNLLYKVFDKMLA
jgi:glycosyltransferase involved in cell wall biosynthesis